MKFRYCSRQIVEWMEENKLFIKAYNAAVKDPALEAEVRQLEKKYVFKNLAEKVGEEAAERIMAERGMAWNGQNG